MDPGKRASLTARREQAKRSARDEAARAALAPALGSLESAGDAYRLVGLEELAPWSPSWLDTGASALPWDRLKPDVWEMFEPGPDFDERRGRAAAKTLSGLICDSSPLRVVYDGQAATLLIAPDIVLRHVAALIAVPAGSIWFSAPPNDWLMDVQRDQLFARRK